MASRARPFSFRSSQVDEKSVVNRYKYLKWSMKKCATEFGITEDRVRAILAAHGIKLHRQSPGPDEITVVTAYRKHRNYRYVSMVMGIAPEKVCDILDRHGIAHDERFRPRQPYQPPKPDDLLMPYQAARILQVTPQWMKAATATGQIPERRSLRGHRRYLRQDVEDLARRLGSLPLPDHDGTE